MCSDLIRGSSSHGNMPNLWEEQTQPNKKRSSRFASEKTQGWKWEVFREE